MTKILYEREIIVCVYLLEIVISFNMATMDEYIYQLLAEIANENSALHHLVQNILYEPIPDFVKGRLLKPLQPGNYRSAPLPPPPAPRKRKPPKERQSWSSLTHYLLTRRFDQSRTTSKRFWRCLKKSRDTSLSSTERHGKSVASCEVGR